MPMFNGILLVAHTGCLLLSPDEKRPLHCSHQSSVYPQDSLRLKADWVYSNWFLPSCWKPSVGRAPRPSALENSKLESSLFTTSSPSCSATSQPSLQYHLPSPAYQDSEVAFVSLGSTGTLRSSRISEESVPLQFPQKC